MKHIILNGLTIEEFTNLVREQVIAVQKENPPTVFIEKQEVPKPKEFLNKKDAAELISVKEVTIELYVYEGDLKPYYLRGKNVPRYKRSDVLGLLKPNKNSEKKEVKRRQRKRGAHLVK